MINQRANFQLAAITLGLILLGGTILGSAPFVFADHDDDAIKAGGNSIEQMLDYNFELRKHIHSIAAVKQGIYDNDLEAAAVAWFELEKDEKIAIWRAPSRGGIFTTSEIKTIRSDEFAALNPARLNQESE